MALDKDAALDGAVAWLIAIRAKARSELSIANLLLDTQPEGISLGTLSAVLNDPSRLTAEEKNLIRQENRIGAIKLIKIRTKLDLKESKVIADAWQDSERAAGRLAPAKSFAPVASLPPPLPASVCTPRALDLDGDETPFDASEFARDALDDSREFRPADDTPFSGTVVRLELD